MKKSFVLHHDSLSILKKLTNEQAGLLFKAIADYNINGVIEHVDPLIDLLLTPFISQFERDQEKSRTGEYHWNWQGGITPINKSIRNSPELREWRKNVLYRDNWTCQKCFKRGRKLQAHHIKPFSTHPELRIELSNGQTLCKKCHLEVHKK